ncbi:penicillin-insensitive murein endopeptidase [Enhygromyxa salina]|uniref:Penicillin-insensitive murein endopeptidase n=1 Tax=Enhygromyxa salina TaxID=215803 RepID=A0A2S9XCC0_9BACT|nr:penicillin-insensitive murein endopeptidase [Enhygromyxa salina]PRP90513.1 penicillin-insensitive murein endopeptidase [Enhygromyxa salina]
MRVELLCLSALLSACEAVAAAPVERLPPAHSVELGRAQALEMREISVLDEALEPAVDEVVAFAPSWRMPAHEPGPLPTWIRHPTLPRETIEELALRYDVRAHSIREWNDMAADAQPHPWRPKALRIHARRYPPPRQLVEHEVIEGDSWGTIARRYGVDYRRLRAWNVRELGRSLELGERVQIWIDPIVFNAIVNDQPTSDRAALVRPGAHGVGVPRAGALVAGVQIPPGERYRLSYPKSAYGTTWAVRQTVAALDCFAATSDYPHPIKVGTMSRQRGGKIGGHISHQTGRDLDIRLPLRAEVPQGLKPSMRRVDWATTWTLVSAFASAAIVQVIFLDYGSQRRLYKAAKAAGASEEQLDAMIQYPRGSKASLGLIRHSPGHEGHIHVRFPCGPAEPECADL